ncbi:excalibur calcium-binding domain-containing protein [Fictibacillus barbaricus]|uniref:Excalibur calcium-binding domain-containing protein n=1 Tax=Fictibacillus barbaricus TaxID=182136 RepID=A0ABS2ZAA9_9BACL|nr:excalibur calcium-binding domain-containing protein [Fictibacillus barbaricus]
MVEETPEDQKQSELEAAAALKKFEEEQKRVQEESDRLAAKREAEERNKPQPKPELKKPATPLYNFEEDKDCRDFNNSTEATSFMKASKAAGFGDHRLDYNHDGIACN